MVDAGELATEPRLATLGCNEVTMPAAKIFLGRSTQPEHLELKFANRHGLIAGATGTGKTISLQVLAEGFADAGVPVFAADIKGDLSGIAEAGVPKDNLLARANEVRAHSLVQHGIPDGVLGSLRRSGPSCPCDRREHGAAAPVSTT